MEVRVQWHTRRALSPPSTRVISFATEGFSATFNTFRMGGGIFASGTGDSQATSLDARPSSKATMCTASSPSILNNAAWVAAASSLCVKCQLRQTAGGLAILSFGPHRGPKADCKSRSTRLAPADALWAYGH